MKQVTIDLAGPFEEIVANLSTLPPTDNLIGRESTAVFELSPEVQEVLRSLYEAARGRQIATQIGLVPAGPPPIAPFLKEAPFEVVSQADFLLQALARLYRGYDFDESIPSRKNEKQIKDLHLKSPRFSGRRPHRISHAIQEEPNYHDQPAYSYHDSPS